MEEKLSQQSHTEIKAPVSRLSTNLQSTFRQRYDHFDSKRAHSAPAPHYTAPIPSGSGSACMCSMICDGLSHLPSPRAETLCLRLLARPPVSHCLSSRPRHSPCARLGRPPAVSLPSRDTYAREQTTHVFRFSLRSTSCSSVCERLINIEIGFPWEHMGTHSRAESPKKWDSSEYLQPPNCVTTASFAGRRLTR